MMYEEIPGLDWRKVDRALGLPSDDGLRTMADQINALKKPGQGRPGIVNDHRLIGLAGERAFARTFKLQMDLRHLKFGNQRKNFVLTNGMRIDVVTRRPFAANREPNLAVPLNTRAKVDVWVLMIWLGWGIEPVIRGWISEGMAKKYGWIQTFHEKGVPNRVVGAQWLAPISGLMFLHKPRDPMAVELPANWWPEREVENELMKLAKVEFQEEDKKLKKLIKAVEKANPKDQLKLF